jgi:hypothetical protein
MLPAKLCQSFMTLLLARKRPVWAVAFGQRRQTETRRQPVRPDRPAAGHVSLLTYIDRTEAADLPHVVRSSVRMHAPLRESATPAVRGEGPVTAGSENARPRKRRQRSRTKKTARN